MFHERYSIEVSDDCVFIYGDLSIREAFDFLNYFEKEGFDFIGDGYENSSLSLYKKVKKEECEKKIKFESQFLNKIQDSVFSEESIEKNNNDDLEKCLEEYKILLNQAENENSKLISKILYLESKLEKCHSTMNLMREDLTSSVQKKYLKYCDENIPESYENPYHEKPFTI